MACMTLFAQPMAMATTQLARAIRFENASTQREGNPERNPLHLSWAVVTDDEGGRKLQMQWTPSADLR